MRLVRRDEDKLVYEMSDGTLQTYRVVRVEPPVVRNPYVGGKVPSRPVVSNEVMAEFVPSNGTMELEQLLARYELGEELEPAEQRVLARWVVEEALAGKPVRGHRLTGCYTVGDGPLRCSH